MPHPGVDGTEYPLGHGWRVAARGIAHGDAVLGAIVQIDVVGADGCRADESHAAAVEQVGIAAGAGADNERVGLAHDLAGDVARLQIQDLGIRLDQAMDVWDMIVDDDCHGAIRLAAKKAMQPAMSRSRNT